MTTQVGDQLGVTRNGEAELASGYTRLHQKGLNLSQEVTVGVGQHGRNESGILPMRQVPLLNVMGGILPRQKA